MDEKMVSLRINDIPVTVPAGTTVLEAARSAGFNIPSLCFLVLRVLCGQLWERELRLCEHHVPCGLSRRIPIL